MRGQRRAHPNTVGGETSAITQSGFAKTHLLCALCALCLYFEVLNSLPLQNPSAQQGICWLGRVE